MGVKNLIKKILKESEDDFDWIRDIQPVSYEFLSGKALEFNPPITDDRTLWAILNFLINLGFDVGEWFDSFDFDEDIIVGLYMNDNNRVVYTTELWDEDYQEHINGYAEHDVKVLNGWDIVISHIDLSENTITESEEDEWDWVRDITPGIKLEPNTTYYIDCSETGFDEDVFLNKLIGLFGEGDWVRSSFSTYSPFNWFNNDVLRNAYPTGRCALILRIGRNYNIFTGGYNPPRSFNRSIDNVLTPEQFLNSWI